MFMLLKAKTLQHLLILAGFISGDAVACPAHPRLGAGCLHTSINYCQNPDRANMHKT